MDDIPDFGETNEPQPTPIGYTEDHFLYKWPVQQLPGALEPESVAPNIFDPDWSYWGHTVDIAPNGHSTIEARHIDHDTVMPGPQHGWSLFSTELTESSRNTGNEVLPQAGSSQPEWNNRVVVENTAFSVDAAFAGHIIDTPTQGSLENVEKRRCVIDSCPFRYDRESRDYKTHLRESHANVFTCDQCTYVGKSQVEVQLHASRQGHAAFACTHEDCEKKFSRLDTYQRHQRTHREDAKRFPCKYCRKYRGSNGFKRRDHLNQHVRNYHHIDEDKAGGTMFHRQWCPKKECPDSKPPPPIRWQDTSVFASSKDWIKHRRTVHDDSDFPCPQPGCDRVNGKGYFRKPDLRAHLRKVHGTDGALPGDDV